MHDINVLFVGINYQYMNPTQSLLPAALSQYCSVYYYGHGFVSNETLHKGIDEFVSSIGSIDVIVTTCYYAGDYTAERLNEGLRRHPDLERDSISNRSLADIKDFLRLNKRKVIVSLLDVDVFASSHSKLESYLCHGTYFIGAGAGSFDLSHPDLEKEPFIRFKKNKGIKLGLYNEFGKEIESRLINLMHIISESEFYWKALSLRPHDVAVPGTAYYRRASVYRRLKNYPDIKTAGKTYEIPFRTANRLGLKPFSNIYIMKLYNVAFQRLLSRSKVCVTDGGLIDFTIRKFFEIPAAGSLLICWPTTDFHALGFESGRNCLSISREDEAIEYTTMVANEPDMYQKIAISGQRLIMEQHSLGARSKQLYGALQRIVKGEFYGSYWDKGQFLYSQQNN